MTPNDPFANFRTDDGPSDDGMAKLDDLLTQLTEAEQVVLDAEAALKKAQGARDTLAQVTIPEHMEDALGLEEVKTKSGVKVKVTKTIRASMGKRKAEALAWLEKHGHGGLIKRTLSVAFDRDEQDAATALAQQLGDEFDVKADMKVEASTLAAFVREQMEAGVDVPSDIFSVFEQRKVKVTTPK